MQKLLVDTTPTLRTYPRVSPAGGWLRRQPTSATVKITTPNVTDDTFSAAVVQAYSTTLSAAVEEGDTDISVAANTGFVSGCRYLIAVEGDDSVEVEAKSLTAVVPGSPTVIRLSEPIPRDIPTGAVVESWSITKALTAQQTDTAGNCVARWRAVIDGETHQWDEPFRIVHRIPVSPLTPSRLMQAYPVMQTLRPEKDTDLEETIRLAWEHEVLPMLEVKGFHEEYIQSTDALEPVHALACVLMLARPSPSFPRETLVTLEALQLAKTETMFARTSWYAAPAPETTPQPAPEAGTPEPQFALVSR